MDIETRVRRLTLAVQVLFAAIIIGAGLMYMRSVDSSRYELSLSNQSGTLHVGALSDGPFVVTHVVAYGAGEPEKRIAALVPALAIIDSNGANIDLKKLKWTNFFGEPADAPTTQRIEVLYSRPLSTNSKQ